MGGGLSLVNNGSQKSRQKDKTHVAASISLGQVLAVDQSDRPLEKDREDVSQRQMLAGHSNSGDMGTMASIRLMISPISGLSVPAVLWASNDTVIGLIRERF